jgi:hypothetical protein
MFSRPRRSTGSHVLSRGALCAIVVAIAAPAWAESSRVILVEEHWELHLTQPDPGLSAPQTTMVMCPTDNLEDEYFLFTLNHSTVPNYQPGGMQVQLWNGEEVVETQLGAATGALSSGGEVVRWVQRMTLADGTLTFQIDGGSSNSWGVFGGEDLTISLATPLESLNKYRPAISLTDSGVSYAENRVETLVLKKLVWVTEDGTVHEHNAPIPIDTSLE